MILVPLFMIALCIGGCVVEYKRLHSWRLSKPRELPHDPEGAFVHDKYFATPDRPYRFDINLMLRPAPHAWRK